MKSDGLANFLLGLGVGIGLGVLFAPRSGEETRNYIKDKADEGADYLKRQTEDLRADLKAKADDLADKSRDVLNRQRDNLSEAIHAGKEAYREKIDSMSAKPV
jgi:gas vesicle protein